MVLVLNLGNTPGVLTTLDNTAVVGLDVLLGTDNGERHGSHEAAGVGSGVLVVLLDGRGVDLDALGLNDSANLMTVNYVSNFILVRSNSLSPCNGPDRRGSRYQPWQQRGSD